MEKNIFDISSKNAIIVGGIGDLGWAIAQGYYKHGANVVIIDIKSQSHSIKPDLKNSIFTSIKADISNENEIEKAFEKAIDIFGGRIDILVNSAGIQRRMSSENFSTKDWNEVISVNLTATFIFSKLVCKSMIKSNIQGKIINIASMQSFFGGLTIPAYAASKGGVAQLTKAFSNDLSSKGININAIAPGYMDTQLNTTLKNDKVRLQETMYRIPIGRWGEPNDLVGLAIFLASGASNYLTGAIIPVDGGFSGR